MQAFSCLTVTFLTNELFFKVANQKARKPIDNVSVILNKIHSSFTASFPPIYSRHLIMTILGSCYRKKEIVKTSRWWVEIGDAWNLFG